MNSHTAESKLPPELEQLLSQLERRFTAERPMEPVKPVQLPKIDASEAIKALGIKGPVTFKPAAFQEPPRGPGGWLPAIEAGIVPTGLTLAGVDPDDPHVINVDLNALHYAMKYGHSLHGPSADPGDTLAHELIHVKQMEDQLATKTAAQVKAEYEKTDYNHNPYEREAFAKSHLYKHMVKVTMPSDDAFPMDLKMLGND